MTKIADKLVDLDYNEIITLKVIEEDQDLTNLLTKRTPLSFNILYSIAKENKLNPETKEILQAIFHQLILTKESLVEKYKRIAHGEKLDITITPQPIATEKPIIKEKPITTEKPIIKEKKLPRRYGLNAVKKDIEKQGGKPTNTQLTAISVNNMKNLWVNLSNRLIKDMLLDDTQKLSDEDYRIIRSTITILENKIKPILNKK